MRARAVFVPPARETRDPKRRPRARLAPPIASGGDASSGDAGDPSPSLGPVSLPGSNRRALEKAKGLPADALVLDLEDAVAPSAKSEVRDRVCDLITQGAYAGRFVAVRINAIGTEWHTADFAAVASAGPDAIVIPKLNSAAEAIELDGALPAAGAPERTTIWAMLETPWAVLHAGEIASATPRLTALLLGVNDLQAQLRAESMPGRAQLLTSLSLCVLAARGSGKAIFDGVYNEIHDLRGFEDECLQARQLGFDGKTLIHPTQIEACNRLFSPSPEALAQARRVIAAFEQAARAGIGVATLDGVMIERMHVDSARSLLSDADSSGARQIDEKTFSDDV